METKKLTAKDLMIGDWVLCVDSTYKNKVYAQIDAIEEGQRSILLRKENTNWFLFIDFIEPIPLTAEILDRIGFIKGLWGTYNLPNTTLAVEINAYGSMFFRFSDCRICEIESVSHLQHLMRDLGINKEIVL